MAPGASRASYILTAAILLAVAASWALSRLPRGIPYSWAGAHEGLLHIPEKGLAEATFTGAKQVREEARGLRGPQFHGRPICIGAEPDVREQLAGLRATLGPVPPGGTSLWIRFEADKHWGRFPCHARRHRDRHAGTLLWLTRIMAARPLGCDRRVFVSRNLSCPPKPPPPRPALIDDAGGLVYPEAARRAGLEGTVEVRLLVGGGNTVVQCDVARSSGHALLDEGTCAMLRTRPDLIARGGDTFGLATGMRQVTQRVVWTLE